MMSEIEKLRKDNENLKIALFRVMSSAPEGTSALRDPTRLAWLHAEKILLPLIADENRSDMTRFRRMMELARANLENDEMREMALQALSALAFYANRKLYYFDPVLSESAISKDRGGIARNTLEKYSKGVLGT